MLPQPFTPIAYYATTRAALSYYTEAPKYYTTKYYTTKYYTTKYYTTKYYTTKYYTTKYYTTKYYTTKYYTTKAVEYYTTNFLLPQLAIWRFLDVRAEISI
jgi:hypothetical protein